MKHLSVQEHITALFMVALFHWMRDEDEAANSIIEIAVYASNLSILGQA